MTNRIKVLRAERGWSQATLASMVGVSRNSIISIENGRFDPSLPLAFAIADAFGLTIEEIFQREARVENAEDPDLIGRGGRM
jgi:putative transcriptional regulator